MSAGKNPARTGTVKFSPMGGGNGGIGGGTGIAGGGGGGKGRGRGGNGISEGIGGGIGVDGGANGGALGAAACEAHPQDPPVATVQSQLLEGVGDDGREGPD